MNKIESFGFNSASKPPSNSQSFSLIKIRTPGRLRKARDSEQERYNEPRLI